MTDAPVNIPAPPGASAPPTLDPSWNPGEGLGIRARVRMPPASALDFTCRANPGDDPEWMDEPCPYERFRDCVQSIGVSNRWTFANLPTMQFLRRAAARLRDAREPLRILDVGSGGGDTLRGIARWAHRRGISVQLTGMDLNPHAARAAEELSRGDRRYDAIQWLTGNVYTAPEAADPGLVISSQMTHHMEDAQVAEFLRWMEATARHGWFVNDLLRSSRSYAFYRVFSRLIRLHPYVQHDGPISIRRGFRAGDWQRLLREAGVGSGIAAITQPMLGRLCVTRLR